MEVNRKRPLLSFSRSISEINDGPVGSKIQRPESPRKIPRPRSSVFLSLDRVKDLRSHRVFSPSSEISWDTVNQKLGFGYGCADTESEQIGKIDSGFPNEDRGNDNGVLVSEGIGVSNGNCRNIDSDPKTNSLIRPCVRGKVYKTPGSVSYKRLLPYLINISEPNPRDREIDRCSKLDKGIEEKKLQATLSSLSNDASKQSVKKLRVSVENCCNESFHGGEIQLTSSETVALSSSTDRTEVLAECQNGHIQKSDDFVSSLNSMSKNSESHMPISVEDSLNVKDDVILKHCDVNKIKDNVAAGETEYGFSSLVREGDFANLNPCKHEELVNHSEDIIQPVIVHHIEGQKQTEEKDLKCGDVGNITNQVDDLNEQSNQMTPPDSEICVRPDVEGNEADRPDYVLQDRDNLNGNLSNGVNHEIASLVCNTSRDIDSKCRAIPKPRSQTKLFKCPGSFSYRRMLPFLTGIANDNFDAKASGQLEKPDKSLERPASLASDNQEIHLDKPNVGFEEKQKDVSVAPPITVQTPTNGPTKDDKNVSDIHCVSEKSLGSLALVESVQYKSRPVLLLSSSDSESKSKDELTITESNHVTSEAEEGLSKSVIGLDIVKSVVDRPSYSLPELDCPVSSRIPSGGPRRGILKRNPRGCRGICTCLNCASFRLHADRAFEFSRNQMEDTEELVLDLVNELSYLRSVLEKTADFDRHVNQVKEACKKASEAEVVAKNRLSLMNYDLGVHCRITCVERPRIKFANHVEEHLIPKACGEEPKQEQ